MNGWRKGVITMAGDEDTEENRRQQLCFYMTTGSKTYVIPEMIRVGETRHNLKRHGNTASADHLHLAISIIMLTLLRNPSNDPDWLL
jgi:hypothetical protein